MAVEHLPKEVRDLYEVYDHRHAIAILATEFPGLFDEICSVLVNVRITTSMIVRHGGSESEIPRLFSRILRPNGWNERELTAKILIDDVEQVRSETHRIDFIKDRVAIDVEWNSKDQTFDRDLFAFRAFFEYNKISVGVLITRSSLLQKYFQTLGSAVDKHNVERLISAKYGNSTTHMDKLRPRLDAGRSGGCPVLALGITRKLIINQ